MDGDLLMQGMLGNSKNGAQFVKKAGCLVSDTMVLASMSLSVD